MKRLILLSCVLFLFSTNLWAWSFSLFGNYDDCVLDRMETGMGGHAVSAIKASCRSKYPLKKKKIEVDKKWKAEVDKRGFQRDLEYKRKDKAKKYCFDYIRKVSKTPRTLDIRASSDDFSEMFNSMEITKIHNGYKVANVHVSESRGRYKATCYLGKNGNVIDFTTSNY